jgi:hypothetical protein
VVTRVLKERSRGPERHNLGPKRDNSRGLKEISCIAKYEIRPIIDKWGLREITWRMRHTLLSKKTRGKLLCPDLCVEEPSGPNGQAVKTLL